MEERAHDESRPASPYEKIVTVLVGPIPKKWHLHEEALAKMSGFFRAAFRSPFKESQEGVLRLPEDDPRTFKLFVGYIYSYPVSGLKGLHLPLPPIDGLKIMIRDYLGLYVFASKYLVQRLETEAIDLIFDYYAVNSIDHDVSPLDAEFVYQRTPEGSKLRELLTRFAVLKVMSGESYPSQGRRYTLRQDSDFTRDKLELIRRCSNSSGIFRHPGEPTKCEFHNHPAGQSCSPSEG